MNRWEILGIEPTSDAAAIRAAYSERAKGCHPEDNPEGFALLREAYKSALRGGGAQGMAPAPAATATAAFAFDTLEGGKEKQAPPEEPEKKESSLPFAEIADTAEPAVQVAAPPATGKPELDFDTLDTSTQGHKRLLEEGAKAFIAKAQALYSNRKLRKQPGQWQALLADPGLPPLLAGEESTWLLIDYFTGATKIPEDINKNILFPFYETWRARWNGTPLWNEFDTFHNLQAIWAEQRIAPRKAFIAQLTGLFEGGAKQCDPAVWRALFANPVFLDLKDEEHFAGYFCLLLGEHQVPKPVWDEVLEPILAEMIGLHEGTAAGKKLQSRYTSSKRLYSQNSGVPLKLIGVVCLGILAYLVYRLMNG